MEAARPLHDVLAGLAGAGDAAGDLGGLLREHGHPGLPAELIDEAVASYAGTAPFEVAEHLAAYVSSRSVVGTPGEAAGSPDLLALLVSAPAGAAEEDVAAEPEQPADLDFGTGAGADHAVPEHAVAGLPGDAAAPGADTLDWAPDPAGLDAPDDVAPAGTVPDDDARDGFGADDDARDGFGPGDDARDGFGADGDARDGFGPDDDVWDDAILDGGAPGDFVPGAEVPGEVPGGFGPGGDARVDGGPGADEPVV